MCLRGIYPAARTRAKAEWASQWRIRGCLRDVGRDKMAVRIDDQSSTSRQVHRERQRVSQRGGSNTCRRAVFIAVLGRA